MRFYHRHYRPGRRYVSSVLGFLPAGVLLLAFFLGQQITFLSHLHAQQTPTLFFDKQGMTALRDRILNDSRLSKIWSRYKKIRIDREAMEIDVPAGPMTEDLSEGRAYGDALADLTLAYIVTRDEKYVRKAKEIALKVAAKSDWGDQLIIAHIDIGMAFFWDVLQDELSSGERNQIISAVQSNANNHINPNPLSNHNWTPSAGEGLIGLSFGGSGASNLLREAKENFKEGAGSVLWAHGNDGFSPQGPGYWRKYNHLGLFLYALRLNEPENDWFHLGKEYPGSEFLENSAYPRIYGDVQHPDLACVSWNDSQVIGYEKQGPYGNLGALIMAASEYKDGYVMDFVDYLLNDAGFRVESEDLAAFLLYNNEGVPQKSYRDLPLSRYFHDMEAAIFRSGWDKNALLFFMRCGSPGGHVRTLKDLPADKHSHTDANGFVLFYDNDYLAAEDGHKPHSGMPDAGNTITYGHNTILVDGKGQKGDGGKTANGTTANMDYMDAEHIGFLLGDATDAYRDLDRFYRYAVYRKHKYVVIVDELKDDASHKYEFLLGTDHRHSIRASSGNSFTVQPEDGTAKLPVIFVEPRQINYDIDRERPYVFGKTQVDLLKVAPANKSGDATFLALLYPGKQRDPEPSYTPIYHGEVSGIQIDGDEYHFYNKQGSEYTFDNVSTDAKLCYYKDDPQRFEYLAAGARQFSYGDNHGIRSTKPLVAAFKGQLGQIRLGKNLGESGQSTITIIYPGISGVRIDGQIANGTIRNDGEFVFQLAPKERKIGPSGYEQIVTENYQLEILLGPSPPSLTLTSPNGDEHWQAGSIQEIRWRSTGTIPEVRLDYSPDNGQTWESISERTANDGNYRWNLPDSPSEAGLIRVLDVDNPDVNDVSDDLFSITTDPGTPASTKILQCIEDTYVREKTPEKSYGGNSDLRIRKSSRRQLAYLKFDVSELTGQIVKAELSLHVLDGSDDGGAVYEISDTYAGSGQPWTEDGLNWDNAPPASGPPLSTANQVNTNDRVIFDVSGAVKSEGVYSFVLGNESSNIVMYSSKEGQNAPELILTLDPDVNPPQPPLPVISSFSPASAPVGSQVQILGFHLSGTSAVHFGNQEAGIFSIISGNELIATIPEAASNGKIRVTTPAGTASSERELTVLEVPPEHLSITAFTPASGVIGSAVTIFGTNLDPVTGVSFDATSATRFEVLSETMVEVKVPAGATTGRISVKTPDSRAESEEVFSIEKEPAASIETDLAVDAQSRTGTAFPTIELAKTAAANEHGALESENWHSTTPEDFILHPVYPNPFNAETRIRYGLPEPVNVTLSIFNIRGQLVRRLVDGFESAGFKEVSWNGRDDFHQAVGSGIYWMALQAGDRKFTKTMVLQR